MNKKIIYTLLFVAAAILQLSFFPVISTKGVAIDLILMMILAWSVIDGYYSFFNWAIFFGILYDLISYSVIGTHALIFLLVVYFVSFFSRRLSIDIKGIGILLLLLSVLVVTIGSSFIIAGVQVWKLQTLKGFFESFGGFKEIMVGLFFNSVLFFFSFSLIKKTKKFFAIEY